MRKEKAKYKLEILMESYISPNAPIRQIRNSDGTIRHEQVPEIKFTTLKFERIKGT